MNERPDDAVRDALARSAATISDPHPEERAAAVIQRAETIKRKRIVAGIGGLLVLLVTVVAVLPLMRPKQPDWAKPSTPSPTPSMTSATPSVSTSSTGQPSVVPPTASEAPSLSAPPATTASAEPSEPPTTSAPAATSAPPAASASPARSASQTSSSATTKGTSAQLGGPLPADATEVTAIWNSGVDPTSDTGIIITPSGNIGCDIWDGPGEARAIRCSATTWQETPPSVITEPGFGQYYVILPETGTAKLQRGKTDPFNYQLGQGGAGNGMAPQTVGYGQTVYYGPFACTSLESGLTCWNYQTGNGFTVTADSMTTF